MGKHRVMIGRSTYNIVFRRNKAAGIYECAGAWDPVIWQAQGMEHLNICLARQSRYTRLTGYFFDSRLARRTYVGFASSRLRFVYGKFRR